MVSPSNSTVRVRVGESSPVPISALRYRESALARANNPLPWTRGVLNDGALASISALIDRVAHRPEVYSPFVLQGAYWVQAMLTTGRTLDALVCLPIFDLEPRVQTEWVPHGLYRGVTTSAWWLPAGGPTSKQIRLRKHNKLFRRRSENILTWAGPRSRRLLDAILDQAFIQIAGDGHPRYEPVLSSFPAAGVWAFLRHLPKEQRPFVTQRRIENWLYSRILRDTGDAALAGILTNNVDQLSNATAHYTWISRKDAFARHHAAVADLERSERHTGKVAPGKLPRVSTYQDKEDEGYGGRFVPKSGLVSDMCCSLQAEIERSRPRATSSDLASLSQFHTAFTLYSLAFLGFAGGLRAVRHPMPLDRSIDRSTGFVAVRDKGRENADRTRLLWLTDAALEQLDHFQRHMRHMTRLFPDRLTERSIIEGAAQPRRFSETGQWVDAPLSWWSDELEIRGFPFKLNVWRHYLRTELVQRVPADVLQAFLGHFQRGQEPWARHSCLDPLVYRAELKHALEPMLERAGWRAVAGLA